MPTELPEHLQNLPQGIGVEEVDTIVNFVSQSLISARKAGNPVTAKYAVYEILNRMNFTDLEDRGKVARAVCIELARRPRRVRHTIQTHLPVPEPKREPQFAERMKRQARQAHNRGQRSFRFKKA